MSRRNSIEIDAKSKKKLERMLLGDMTEALKAKQFLHMKAARLEKTNPDEAKLLRKVTKRIRIKV